MQAVLVAFGSTMETVRASASYDESQYESVDGKATKILDRLWAMTDGEIIETLLEEGLIF